MTPRRRAAPTLHPGIPGSPLSRNPGIPAVPARAAAPSPRSHPGIPGSPESRNPGIPGSPESRNPGIPAARNPGIPGIARVPRRAARPEAVPEFPESRPVPVRRRGRARAAALALLALAPAAGPAAAEGGSFTLCYERLKQLAALYAAQGAEVSEPVDDPGARRYALELRIAGSVRRLACGPDGRIERPAEE